MLTDNYFKKKPFGGCSIFHYKTPLDDCIWLGNTQKDFRGNKPCSKVTLRTKCYHSWGCCDNSQCCEQLKKYGTDKYSVNTTANKYYSSAGHHEQKNKKVTGQFRF